MFENIAIVKVSLVSIRKKYRMHIQHVISTLLERYDASVLVRIAKRDQQGVTFCIYLHSCDSESKKGHRFFRF